MPSAELIIPIFLLASMMVDKVFHRLLKDENGLREGNQIDSHLVFWRAFHLNQREQDATQSRLIGRCGMPQEQLYSSPATAAAAFPLIERDI